jgi:hypothetical protein
VTADFSGKFGMIFKTIDMTDLSSSGTVHALPTMVVSSDRVSVLLHRKLRSTGT